MILKKYENRNVAETLQIFAMFGGYSYPLMRGIHSLKFYTFMDGDRASNGATWIKLELTFFFAYILSLMVFLYLAYWVKFKSIRKQKYDLLKVEHEEEIEVEAKALDFNGIWNNKSSDDFLRYLKWEAFNYGYFFTMIIVLGYIVYRELLIYNDY